MHFRRIPTSPSSRYPARLFRLALLLVLVAAVSTAAPPLADLNCEARAPGTAGSTGVGYLGKTLFYNFFPELWEARNRLTAEFTPHPG